jgi:quinol monooxygenase YgiN
MMKTMLVLLATIASSALGVAMTDAADERHVRVAELEIDAAQASAFAAALREVGQASVRSEEGCLALYAVAEKQDPSRVRVFEIYRDRAAYEAHLLTPHFKKFRATTEAMVKSRKLIEATPLSLATKPGITP